MKILLLIIAILLLLLITVIYADTHRFVIRTYTVQSELLSGEKTICLISDLHECENGRQNERLIDAVRGIQPDLVISAGDLLTAHKRAGSVRTKEALHLMRALAAAFPLYAAHGNHEQKMDEETDEYGDLIPRFEEALAEAGVRLLRNNTAQDALPGLNITGFEADLAYIKKKKTEPLCAEEMRAQIGTPDPSRFTLLIAHDPAFFDAYAEWGADLVVSGHVHGGIVRLPLIGGVVAPPFVLFPRYDGGYFEQEAGGKLRRMIVSAGLGEHTLPARFNNPRELTVIRLKGKELGTGS